MATYTIFEARQKFGVDVIEKLENMERKPVKNMTGGRGDDFFHEYKTDKISVGNQGRVSLCVFQPKDGTPEREYVEFTDS